MNKSTQTALNALALAGMLVFASQSADAASTSVDTANTPATVKAQHAPTVKDSTPDVADTHDADARDVDTHDVDTHEADSADNIADIGNQEIETPDVGEFETPDSN